MLQEILNQKNENIMKNNFYSAFSFVSDFPFRDLAATKKPNPNSLDIHWVVPHFDKGAGGLTTILRFVKGLESLGHKCTVWVNLLKLHGEVGIVDYKKIINESYFPINAEVKLLPKNIECIAGDALIATDRYTCYPVRSMNLF